MWYEIAEENSFSKTLHKTEIAFIWKGRSKVLKIHPTTKRSLSLTAKPFDVQKMSTLGKIGTSAKTV